MPHPTHTAAAPFGPEEFEGRILRLREVMARDGLAAMVFAGPENIYYLTGLNHGGYFAFTGLVVPATGAPRIVARAMEATTIAVQIPQCVHEAFADYERPGEALARAVHALVSTGDQVAVETGAMFFPIDVWEDFRAKTEDLRIVSAAGRLETLRAVKSAAEIACVRQAAALTSQAVKAGIETVAEGVSLQTVAASVYGSLIAAGSEPPGFSPLIRPRDALLQEHVSWTDRRVTRGDAVFMELSASVRRYHAPMTRMAYLGEPPAGTDEAGAIAAAGLRAVAEALRPGAIAAEVYDAWQRVIDDGLGHHDYRRHHCGYMVGIGFPPSWVGGSAVVGLRDGGGFEIRAGMTFHVLSWILDQKPADFVVSDTVLVTANGGEILTDAPRDTIVR